MANIKPKSPKCLMTGHYLRTTTVAIQYRYKVHTICIIYPKPSTSLFSKDYKEASFEALMAMVVTPFETQTLMSIHYNSCSERGIVDHIHYKSLKAFYLHNMHTHNHEYIHACMHVFLVVKY